MATWTKEVVDLSVAGSSLTIDSIKIDGTIIGHTDDTDLLSLASGTLTINGNITATGTITGTLSNITITNDLTLAATKKLYLDGGTHTYFHESSNDVVQLASGVDNLGDTRVYNMAPKSGAGVKNTVYGQNAGANIDANTVSCTYFGSYAGDATHDDADGNTGIGALTLSILTTGDGNTCVGNSAGYATTTGNYNTGLGSYALQAETIGGKSVALGYNALGSQNLAGEGDVNARNIAIGYYSGKNVTTGRKNVMLGWKAGYDADSPTRGTTTGSENILIGGLTEASASTTDNEIVIGYNVTGLGANKTVIGNSDCTDIYMASDSGATVHCTSVTLKETTTPTALADHGKVYTKNDNKLYFQDGAGTEHEIAFA